MKNKIQKGVLVLCVMFIVFACDTKKAEHQAELVNKGQIKKEIQEKENEFAEIYNSGEVKKIGYYADDAITYYQNMKPLQGREARLKFLESDIKTNTNKISFTTREVFVSNDGIQVVEVGYYKVADSTGVAINTGNYMSLFEKRDGKYVCLRDMSASDMTFK
jgi:ketosteroid isomerase-like protein